jgi:hypothetical protein
MPKTKTAVDYSPICELQITFWAFTKRHTTFILASLVSRRPLFLKELGYRPSQNRTCPIKASGSTHEPLRIVISFAVLESFVVTVYLVQSPDDVSLASGLMCYSPSLSPALPVIISTMRVIRLPSGICFPRLFSLSSILSYERPLWDLPRFPHILNVQLGRALDPGWVYLHLPFIA